MKDTFPTLHPYLFSIAYRMLGSVLDAEDMVQETWLRWQKSDQKSVESPKSYLAAVVTRLCIDHLRSAKVTRESYIGPWLPEPLVTSPNFEGEAMMLQNESVSFAFLRLLEQLTPTERAVYLLRHIFEYEYAEIGEIVEKSEVTCRQIFRRAKQHLTAKRPRFTPTLELQQEVMKQFWQACLESDVATLKALVAEDVSFYSDGGGKVTAARRPIHSADKVIQLIMGLVRLAPEGLEILPMLVNGQVGVMTKINGRLFNIFVLDVRRDGRVQTIYNVLNPDKLRHLS